MWFRNIKEINEDLANTETITNASCISFFTELAGEGGLNFALGKQWKISNNLCGCYT